MWIGGRSEVDDIWYWTDGSKWDSFQKWSAFASQNSDEISLKCLYLDPSHYFAHSFDWNTDSCTYSRPFICKFPITEMRKSYKMSLSEMGERIHFWMQLKDMAVEELHEQGKMPGFSFSWRVEGERNENIKDWEVEVAQIGRKIESPGWGENIEEALDDESPIYKASILTDKLAEDLGNEDTLVIKLEIETARL